MAQPSEHPNGESLLTILQVSQYLGVCRAHVYTLIHKGLPIIRLGRLVRVSPQSLQDWLQEQEQSSRLS